MSKLREAKGITNAGVEAVLNQLTLAVGSSQILTTPEDMARYLVDARRRYNGSALCVVRPSCTEEVSKVIATCAEAGVAVVPQGGNTGQCGGATPTGERPAVVVSLERMARIRDVDLANSTITVDAGCRLTTIQEAADKVGKLFPMSLGSEGSCQIGGNISTNAGGTTVLRYGNMRDLVLGLEAVLPDGRIWNGLRRLRKDNTGYDLKHLFIGAEGTLGVVTGAVLKLFTRPAMSITALVSLQTIQGVLALLGELQSAFGEHVTTFEAMSRNEYELVCRTHAGLRDPMTIHGDWYVFIEAAGVENTAPRALLETLLSGQMEDGRILDATIAESLAQAENIWHIRHGVTEANLKAGAAISHDTSVPVSRVPEFVERSELEIKQAFPDAAVLFVGHVGDGNIHVIAILPRERYLDPASFTAVAQQINIIVDRVTIGLEGSISAEHGIGKNNRGRLRRHKDPLELEFMDAIKAVFDPENIMNPGTLL